MKLNVTGGPVSYDLQAELQRRLEKRRRGAWWKTKKTARLLDNLFDRAFDLTEAVEEYKKKDVRMQVEGLMEIAIAIADKAREEGRR